MSSCFYIPGRGGDYTKGLGLFLEAQYECLAGIQYSAYSAQKKEGSGLILEDYLANEINKSLDAHRFDVVVANSYGVLAWIAGAASVNRYHAKYGFLC